MLQDKTKEKTLTNPNVQNILETKRTPIIHKDESFLKIKEVSPPKNELEAVSTQIE